MDLEKIGKFLTMLRKERKLTQAQVGEILEVSDKTVSKWERGICLPENSTVDKLLKLYNIELSDLYSGTIPQKKKDHKKRRKIILLASAISLIFLILIYITFTLVSNNKYETYLIASTDINSYNVDGNISISKNNIIISISNIKIAESKEKIYTKNIEYFLIINNELISREGNHYDFKENDKYKNINTFLKNISIYYSGNSQKNFNIPKIEENDILLKIRYLDENDEEKEYNMHLKLQKNPQ